MSVVKKVKKALNEQNFAYWGLIGSIIILFALLIPQIGYSGRQGESYSMLNHFVSELGEIGVSHLAIVFNVGLIIGGICYLLFMIGLWGYLKGIFAKFAVLIGVLSSICASLVGVFPMNYLLPHYIVAMGFFFGAMITIVLYSIAILLQKDHKVPKWFVIPGMVVAFIYAWMLSYMFTGNTSDLTVNFETRPVFWLLPTLEWAAILSVVIYLLFLSIYARLSQK